MTHPAVGEGGDQAEMGLRLDAPEPLTVTDIPAEPAALGPIRRRLTAWAGTTGIHPDLADDLVLAVYEAMANVSDHAYGPGEDQHFRLQATRTSDGRIVVTVTDHGRWRPPVVDGPRRHRGRGLRLIHELAHDVDLHHDEGGTTVRMTWSTLR